jgi:sigma54-dependent transcription regulator
MTGFLIPTRSPDDWRSLLADPDKHWRDGYSAKSLAFAWESAGGFPPEVRAALEATPEFASTELLLGIPEHQVMLPGGSRPSQSDLWVLGRTVDGLVSMTIEGKVSEPFGPTIEEWLVDASPGKRERLAFLQRQLGLETEVPSNIRYQLLHRTASAVIEARRFRAHRAVMLVHSFSDQDSWLDDFVRFAALMGCDAAPGRIAKAGVDSDLPIHLGWIRGDRRFAARSSQS